MKFEHAIRKAQQIQGLTEEEAQAINTIISEALAVQNELVLVKFALQATLDATRPNPKDSLN